MTDTEWYEVWRAGGQLAGQNRSLTLDQASALAAEAAPEADEPVCVVQCLRTTVRTYQRQVTVTATDVAAVPALDAGSSV